MSGRRHAFAPYSGYEVGAAVLCESGDVVSGCNVENASLGLTICAERVAACTAVAAGTRCILALAVAASGGPPPCGACRQLLAQFGPSMDVLLIDTDNPADVRRTTLHALLPRPFLRQV